MTSGNWALNKQAAERYLEEIDNAIKARNNPCKVTFRVSVSAGHAIKLGTNPAFNLIQIFESKYADHPYLKFQIHGFENDPMFPKVMEFFPGHTLNVTSSKRVSDDEDVIKVIPQKIYVKLASGYEFITGISKIFGSDLRPNLHEKQNLTETIKIFERDLEESEDNNSAVLYNTNGDKGLD